MTVHCRYKYFHSYFYHFATFVLLICQLLLNNKQGQRNVCSMSPFKALGWWSVRLLLDVITFLKLISMKTSYVNDNIQVFLSDSVHTMQIITLHWCLWNIISCKTEVSLYRRRDIMVMGPPASRGWYVTYIYVRTQYI